MFQLDGKLLKINRDLFTAIGICFLLTGCGGGGGGGGGSSGDAVNRSPPISRSQPETPPPSTVTEDITIEEATARLETSRARLAQTEDELATVTNQVVDLETRLATAQDELSTAIERREIAEQNLADVQQQITDANTATQAANAARTDALTARDEAMQALNQANTRLTNAQNEQRTAEQNLADVQQQITDANTAMREANDARTIALSSRDAAVRAQDIAEEALNQANTQLTNAQTAQQTAEQNLADVQQQITDANTATQQANAARTVALTNRDAAVQALNQANAQLTNAQNAQRTAEQNLADVQQQITDANTAMQEANDARTIALTSRDAAVRAQDVAEEALNQANTQLTNAQTAQQTAEQNLADVQQQITDANTATQQANTARTAALTNRDAAEAARDLALQQQREAETLLQQAIQEQRDAEAELERLRLLLQSSNTARDQARAQLVALLDTIRESDAGFPVVSSILGRTEAIDSLSRIDPTGMQPFTFTNEDGKAVNALVLIDWNGAHAEAVLDTFCYGRAYNCPDGSDTGWNNWKRYIDFQPLDDVVLREDLAGRISVAVLEYSDENYFLLVPFARGGDALDVFYGGSSSEVATCHPDCPFLIIGVANTDISPQHPDDSILDDEGIAAVIEHAENQALTTDGNLVPKVLVAVGYEEDENGNLVLSSGSQPCARDFCIGAPPDHHLPFPSENGVRMTIGVSGNSFGIPSIAAVADYLNRRWPELTNADIVQLILQCAEPVDDPNLGRGVLVFPTALDCVDEPTGTVAAATATGTADENRRFDIRTLRGTPLVSFQITGVDELNRRYEFGFNGHDPSTLNIEEISLFDGVHGTLSTRSLGVDVNALQSLNTFPVHEAIEWNRLAFRPYIVPQGAHETPHMGVHVSIDLESLGTVAFSGTGGQGNRFFGHLPGSGSFDPGLINQWTVAMGYQTRSIDLFGIDIVATTQVQRQEQAAEGSRLVTLRGSSMLGTAGIQANIGAVTVRIQTGVNQTDVDYQILGQSVNTGRLERLNSFVAASIAYQF